MQTLALRIPAGADLRGGLEILTLAGSLAPDGPHLHVTVADADGRVSGGQMGPGCKKTRPQGSRSWW